MRIAFMGVTVVGLALGAGCSAAGDDADADGTVTPEEQASRDAEVSRIQERLGEPTCAATAADTTLDAATVTVRSNTATYDHPTCRDAFVVDLPTLKGGKPFAGGPVLGGPGSSSYNFFNCLPNVGFVYLYEKQGTNYVLVGQNAAFGVYGALGSCSALASVTVPRDGDYKAVVAGVQLFGPKLPVSAVRQD
jgi:hypothetical protein